MSAFPCSLVQEPQEYTSSHVFSGFIQGPGLESSLALPWVRCVHSASDWWGLITKTTGKGLLSSGHDCLRQSADSELSIKITDGEPEGLREDRAAVSTGSRWSFVTVNGPVMKSNKKNPRTHTIITDDKVLSNGSLKVECNNVLLSCLRMLYYLVCSSTKL